MEGRCVGGGEGEFDVLKWGFGVVALRNVLVFAIPVILFSPSPRARACVCVCVCVCVCGA